MHVNGAFRQANSKIPITKKTKQKKKKKKIISKVILIHIYIYSRIQQSIRKIIEIERKSISLAHMTAHSPGVVQ